jgi:hypothetical protein
VREQFLALIGAVRDGEPDLAVWPDDALHRLVRRRVERRAGLMVTANQDAGHARRERPRDNEAEIGIEDPNAPRDRDEPIALHGLAPIVIVLLRGAGGLDDGVADELVEHGGKRGADRIGALYDRGGVGRGLMVGRINVGIVGWIDGDGGGRGIPRAGQIDLRRPERVIAATIGMGLRLHRVRPAAGEGKPIFLVLDVAHAAAVPHDRPDGVRHLPGVAGDADDTRRPPQLCRRL